MNAVEIEEAVSQLVEQPFEPETFPYAFLEAFGNKETTIKRLRSGATNKSDLGGVLQTNNIHIAICNAGEVSRTLTALRESPATARAKAKFILATDGADFEAEDLTNGDTVACAYKDFPDHFGFFLALAGISTVRQITENSFDIRATSRMNRLYVELRKDNPDWGAGERRHDMNHFMARLIFCFFAEDTGIFNNDLFTSTVEQMSERTASNTHEVIQMLFLAMNTRPEDRAAANVPRWASGFGLRIRMQSGHLEIEDGIGPDRRNVRLPRVGHGLKRLVCISEDGFTTLSALKWLADVGVSFVMLNRNGKVLLVTGPTAPSDSRLRRAQALAFGNVIGLEISRRLIDAKLDGQERVVREGLQDSVTAQQISDFRQKLTCADNPGAIRLIEAHAAVAYFAAWRNVPVMWPKADLPRIPQHWRTVGSRHSPLSGGPRLAITPVHAILNYCFALLESESRLALAALGLDPGLGLGLHTDTPNRDSLALDVLEPVRPEVEKWVLHWITREPLRRTDFFETTTGNCRLKSHFCAKLSETAPTWGRLVAPWAEHVARTLWASTSPARSERRLSTPLTQQHRRAAKGRPPLATVKAPKPERLCRGCGKPIEGDSKNCKKCDLQIATERIVEVARAGRVAGHTPKAIAKESETHRRHAQAKAAWDPSTQPAWLSEHVFSEMVQPALANASATEIAKRIGVSRQYAACIRDGYRPHPRHWEALARLVEVSANEGCAS